VVTAIGGTAGVGKTTLAVHAAYQLLDEFPDGHLYADLRGYTAGQDPAEPGEVLQVFLRRLGVSAEDVPAELEERSGLLRQVLADRRVLMILDNARTEAQVRPLLPGAGESLALVTSRSVLPGLEVNERISLDTLAPDEAAAMLAQVIGQARTAAEQRAVAEVARLCGRLPLALRIAGQLLAAHPAWPVAKVAKLLADERDRLTQLGAGDLQVRTAFEVSYLQLPSEDARLFRLLGLHPGPDFTPGEAAALAGTEDEAAGLVLDRLAGAHLVTEDAAGEYSMHDLLRLYARATCLEIDSLEDREAAEICLVGYCADQAEFLDSCVRPRLRPAAELAAEQAGEVLPSIREALADFQAERPGLLAALDLAVQRGWDQQVKRFGDSMWDSLTLLRYLDDLLAIQKAALAAVRRAGDRHGEAQTLNYLGDTYVELRRFEEAVDYYQQSLGICRETGDRYGEGQTLRNLGDAYDELRWFARAIGFYQQGIAISRETGDRYGEGASLTGLGIAYVDLRQFGEAVDYFQQSLVICRETGDRRSESASLGNLGIAYEELHRLEDAIGCYQQGLAICRESGDLYGAAQALGNLGNAYMVLRRFGEAVDYYQQSLGIRRETRDRYGEGLILNNLGNAYEKMWRPGRAVEYWRGAAAAMRDAGDHVDAARLEQLAASVQPWSWRRLLSLRRGPSS